MDANLLIRVPQGGGEAFTDLALGIRPRLLGVAYGILRDRSARGGRDATGAGADMAQTAPAA